MKPKLAIIAHNIRSTHNVGSLLRTSDGLGVSEIYFTGYTPYPAKINDSRLPHISGKLTQQIHKTALGAENSVIWHQSDDVVTVIEGLRDQGYAIVGLEQAQDSVSLQDFKCPEKLALLIGSEVTGIDKELFQHLDLCVEIPMVGKKESFNVIEATTMALYQCLVVSPRL